MRKELKVTLPFIFDQESEFGNFLRESREGENRGRLFGLYAITTYAANTITPVIGDKSMGEWSSHGAQVSFAPPILFEGADTVELRGSPCEALALIDTEPSNSDIKSYHEYWTRRAIGKWQDRTWLRTTKK